MEDHRIAFCEKCGQHFIAREDEGTETRRIQGQDRIFIHKDHTCPSCNAKTMVLWLHWLDGREEK